MKKLGCPLAVVVGTGLMVMLASVWQQFITREALSATSPSLFISASPGGGNQAHFVTLGLQDRVITLFVLPAGEPQAAPALLARIELDRKMDTAVWSRDGSVIACRRQNAANEDEYAYAYDFAEKKSYMPQGVTAKKIDDKSRIDWKDNSVIVEKLLASRGGPGPQITRTEIESASRKLDLCSGKLIHRSRMGFRCQ